MRQYYGITIERHPVSGYWQALGPCGWLQADTLAGIKSLIRHVLGKEGESR